MNILEELIQKKIIQNDSKFTDQCCFLSKVGSVCYGASIGKQSDIDLFGCFVPTLNEIYPHENKIFGFDYPNKGNPTETMNLHHLEGGYDLTFHSLVKYLRMLSVCNPNIIETLYVNTNHILIKSEIYNYIRLNRRYFLSKECYQAFSGYAYRNMKRYIENYNKQSILDIRKEYDKYGLNYDTSIDEIKNLDLPEKDYLIKLYNAMSEESKRNELILKYDYDCKGAYHVIRLLLECEQILKDNFLDLESNSELLISIRKGEVPKQDFINISQQKRKDIDLLFTNSKLRDKTDPILMRKILVKSLKMYHGNLIK